MSKELNEALRVWAAQAGAESFVGRGLKVGDYLAYAPRGGVVRHIGRIDGFTVAVRGGSHGPVNVLWPGEGTRTEAVALVRAVVKRSGAMQWAQACQCVGERTLMEEWRAADPQMVRDVLRQIDGKAERRGPPYIDPELSPENGR